MLGTTPTILGTTPTILGTTPGTHKETDNGGEKVEYKGQRNFLQLRQAGEKDWGQDTGGSDRHPVKWQGLVRRPLGSPHPKRGITRPNPSGTVSSAPRGKPVPQVSLPRVRDPTTGIRR